MGILRTDRITGLGGANAIKGSVFFPYVASGSYSHQYQQIRSDDYAFGTGAFTLECWYYMSGDGGHTDSVGNIILLTGTNTLESPSNNGVWLASRNDNKFEARVYYVSGSWNMTMTSTNAFPRQTWHHLAMVRSGSSVKLYVNGVQEASGSNSSDLDTSVSTSLYIGAQGNLTSTGSLGSRGITGYVSNVRVSNEALYTAAFTPPVGELQKLSSTITLCNQSASNVLKEETGKTITLYRKTLNHQLPLATKFTPNSPVGFSTTTDVGSQHGTTFDGFGNFATSSYMVPPGGNTRERNRGRGVLGGGAPFVSPNVINNISYVEIQSGGIFKDFGDLTVARGYFAAGQSSSSTRGIFTGGYTGGSGNNTIDFITIANTGNATDFGDASTARFGAAAMSNQTRALFAGNGTGPAFDNIIDFVTIATLGDAQDFGDIVEARGYAAGASSSTRGVYGGGRNNTPSSNTLKNTMEYVTFSTTGNTQDFGDLQALRYGHTGFSSPTRGIYAGGYLTPGETNSIDYFTIATLGNSIDFGDLSDTIGYCGSVTNSIRGAVTVNNAPSYYNTVEFITIATTGNASDFGDADPLGSGKGHGDFPACASDSHGGL